QDLLCGVMVCFIPEPQFRVSSDQIKLCTEEEIQSGQPEIPFHNLAMC
ncbi:uncharacterized, partial [Tachysurus ichikawai]